MTVLQTELDGRTKVWRIRVFTATWLSYAALYFCRKPFFLAKASLEETFGLDATTLGAMGLAYLGAYTLGQFLAGGIGDRTGPRRMLLVGMAVSIIANLVFGWSNSWWTMAAFLFINGLAQATGWAGNVGAMAPWFRRTERGTVMGLWATNFQVGGVGANLVSSFVLGAYGFRYSFFVGSAVLFAAWLYFFVNQRDRPEDVGLPPISDVDDPTGDGSGSWSADTRINVAILGTFYFFVKFIRYAIWSWVPYMLAVHYGLAKDDAGYLSTVFDASGIAGVIVLGVLSDRLLGGRRVALSAAFIGAMAISCVGLYVLGPTSLGMFGICLGLIGFTLYGPDAILTSAGAIDVGSRDRAALAAGIINGMGSIGAMTQEIVLGRALDVGGVSAAFAMLLTSSILAAVCLAGLMVRNRRGHADM